MAVPYYDLTKVKLDLSIEDTGNDTQLGHWNDEAESEIDDVLYDKAAKARRITALPILPFASGSVPESIQGAADHLVKSRYYEFVKDLDMAKYHKEQADIKMNLYVERLEKDAQIYGRIVR